MAELIGFLFEALFEIVAGCLLSFPETKNPLEIGLSIVGLLLMALGIASACGWI